ncbi:MAG: DUF6470 family protein [Clostridia bacterium]|nr:DUF6470 family protein [Clostridia bacterium]
MDIRITQRFAQIGIDWALPELLIKAPPPDMTLQQQAPDIIITIDYPEVHIDQTQTFAEIGLKKIIPLERELAQEAQVTVVNGIGRRANEGDLLASQVGFGNKIFADIAESNLPQIKESNIDIIPRTPPSITASGGIRVQAVMGDVSVDMPPNLPEIEANLGYVKIYLEQKPYLKIDFVGNNIDIRV